MPRRYVGNGVWEDVPVEGESKEPKTVENNLDIALEDVATRFLTNLPTSELESADRLMFQIEQAHWFYEDFLADAEGSKLPHMNLRQFAQHLFARCALLKPLIGVYEDLFNNFRAYKGHIPVCGLALLDKTMTKIVLVRNWQKTSWGLPKGKLNQNEATLDCAIREVLEETGYDASDKIANSDDPIFFLSDTQPVHVYIVPNVPLDFPFKPRVRKEISAVSFYPIDHLPKEQWKVDRVIPHLKRWMKRRRKQIKAGNKGDKTKGERKSTSALSTKKEDNKIVSSSSAATPLLSKIPKPHIPIPPPIDYTDPNLFSTRFILDTDAFMAAFDAALSSSSSSGDCT